MKTAEAIFMGLVISGAMFMIGYVGMRVIEIFGQVGRVLNGVM